MEEIMSQTISIKYFQIYAAPVDYKANNTVGALKPTTLNFANEQDAKNFCEDNKKIDKLYIQKPKSIDIVSSKEIKIENNSITYFQIYVANVDYKAGNMVGQSKPTTLKFASEKEAQEFCNNNRKIDKLFSYKAKTLTITASYQSKKEQEILSV